MKEQTTIRLPKELKEEIEKEADKRNISFNGMVNQLIYDSLKAIHQGRQYFHHSLFRKRRQWFVL